MSFNTLLLSASFLIIISIIVVRVTNNIGVPVMLLFLGVGMLAGSEGPGGIYFDDAAFTQSLGIVALIYILFSGGLDTKWKQARHVIWSALSLSTIGVIITTLLVGFFVYWYYPSRSVFVCLLFGAIVSSTDAAALFSILGTRNVSIKGNIKPLLELESGTNDPMAVFLTISMIQLISAPQVSYMELLTGFFLEMGLGLVVGIGMGKLVVIILNRLKFPIDGFYIVVTMAFAVFIYAVAVFIHGSGFLAVYVAGIMISNHEIVHKRSIVRFFDAIAWLSQIAMFLTLGLLVYPSRLIEGFGQELIIAFFLIFIARPVSVFISLVFSKYSWREKILLSWVGLRGAVPIILATFPLLAGIPDASWIFNIVFVIVLASALLQGWPIPFIVKFLRLEGTAVKKIKSPIESTDYEGTNMKLINLDVPENRPDIERKSLVQIPQLKGSLIVTVLRDNQYFVPSGGTILEPGDKIQVLAEEDKAEGLQQFFYTL